MCIFVLSGMIKIFLSGPKISKSVIRHRPNDKKGGGLISYRIDRGNRDLFFKR